MHFFYSDANNAKEQLQSFGYHVNYADVKTQSKDAGGSNKRNRTSNNNYTDGNGIRYIHIHTTITIIKLS